MRAIARLALIAAAASMAGCATLSYEGMPPKDEPHAMAVEEGGVDFISVDGRPVYRKAFARPKLRLTPGVHEILTRYDDSRHDTDYIGDLEIAITVHYWSRFAQVIAFEAREGNRYYIGAEANLPSTEISYELWQSELPPDYSDSREGRISINVEHELTNPEDWRPIITRILPIKKYWRNRPLPTVTPTPAGAPKDQDAPPPK